MCRVPGTTVRLDRRSRSARVVDGPGGHGGRTGYTARLIRTFRGHRYVGGARCTASGVSTGTASGTGIDIRQRPPPQDRLRQQEPEPPAGVVQLVGRVTAVRAPRHVPPQIPVQHPVTAPQRRVQQTTEAAALLLPSKLAVRLHASVPQQRTRALQLSGTVRRFQPQQFARYRQVLGLHLHVPQNATRTRRQPLKGVGHQETILRGRIHTEARPASSPTDCSPGSSSALRSSVAHSPAIRRTVTSS